MTRRSADTTDKLKLGSMALAYRWAMVVSSLSVAYLAGPELPGAARLTAIGPVAMSVLITAITYWRPASRWLFVTLAADIGVGVGCVVLTGGAESPFIFYLSAPLLRCAIHSWLAPMIAGTALVLAGLGLSHVADADGRATLPLAANELVVLLAGPWLVFLVVRQLRESAERQTLAAAGWRPVLDQDDLELIGLLRTGATYAAMAEDLGFSLETIKVRVSRLYRRIGAKNRTEALARAEELGIRSDPPKPGS